MAQTTANQGAAGSTPWPVTDAGSSTLTSITATIASGASLSGALNIAGKGLVRILMPAAFSGTALTFQTSMDGVTYYNLYKPDGTEYSVTVAAARAIVLPPADFAGFNYLKVRSGTSGAATTEGADRSVVLVARPV